MVQFKSRTPFTYYFLLTFLIMTILLFSIFAIIERLDIVSAIFCIVLSNLLAFYLFGRYLCILTLKDDTLLLTFLYPFRKTRQYIFKGISEIDFRGDTVRSAVGILVPGTNSAFHRGFYRLYLTDTSGQLFDIKYNISEADNEKLLKALQLKIK